MKFLKLDKLVMDVGVAVLFVLLLMLAVFGGLSIYNNEVKHNDVCSRLSVDSPEYEKNCSIDFRNYQSFIGD
jgi:hypothetical protein